MLFAPYVADRPCPWRLRPMTRRPLISRRLLPHQASSEPGGLTDLRFRQTGATTSVAVVPCEVQSHDRPHTIFTPLRDFCNQSQAGLRQCEKRDVENTVTTPARPPGGERRS